MNERIKRIGHKLKLMTADDRFYCPEYELFADALIKDCADSIRVRWDNEPAEWVAHNLEVEFGLIKDHGEE